MSRLPVRQKPRRQKFCYVGAPAYFKLQQACTSIWQAWHRESFGCYVVGSCLDRPDFRDVDVRLHPGKPAPFPRQWPKAAL